MIAITETHSPPFTRLLAELPSITLGELRELLRLYDLVDSGGGIAPLAVLADQPVHVGGVALYMPTMAATEWLLRRGAWFEDDTERWLWDGYCLAYGRKPAILGRIQTASQAAAAVRVWRPRLGCTLGELQHAIVACLGNWPAPVVVKNGKKTPHDVLRWAVEALSRHGGQLDRWLWAEPLQRAVWIDHAAGEAAADKDSSTPGQRAAMKAFSAYATTLREKYRPAEDAAHG